MNIFFLSRNAQTAARYHCDKHVVKMVLETTQMLSTAARRHNFDVGYQTAYPNHPMTKWVGDSWNNFKWAFILAQSLGREYNRRYNKIHACCKVLKELRPIALDSGGVSFGHSPPPLCMPDEFKEKDYVESYRNYYKDKIYSWETTPRWHGIAIEEQFYTGPIHPLR